MQSTCPTRVKLRWRWWVVLVSVLSLILLLGLRSPMPKVVILPLAEPAPSPLQRLVERGWWWVQFHLPGHRRSIVLRAQVLAFRVHPDRAELALEPPAASTNGVQVWVLEAANALALKQTLQQFPGTEVLSGPSIQTLSRMRGTVAAGYTVIVDEKPEWVGVEVNSFPKLHKNQIDLTSGVKFTDPVTNQLNQLSIRTNLAVRTRIQIPIGGGVFLLGNQANGKTTAVLLSTSVQ